MKQLRTGLIIALLSFVAHANDFDELQRKANQRDPDAQYSLGLHYLNGLDVEPSPEQAQYWFEQAAENGQQSAQNELITLLLKQDPTNQELEQALYWLTLHAANGEQASQIKIARFYEQYTAQLKPDSLAIIWYRIASHHSSQAEEKYNQLLQDRFNQRRLKQVTQLEQLNFISPLANVDPSLSTLTNSSSTNGLIRSDYVSILLIFFVIIALSFLTIRKKKQIRASRQIQSANLSQLNKQLRASKRSEQKLRQQLTSLVTQYKKLQQTQKSSTIDNPSSSQTRLHNACILFGCEPSTIPDEKILKQRYRYLSKAFHPDAGGDAAAMSQLNQAVKLLVSIKKSSIKK